ncbi:MAG TPA: cation diffusion facilitator family transporter [Solirubrobacteraceae bacterium]
MTDHEQSPKKSVYMALFANTVIAIAKAVAAAVSGSSAMLAEALHSLADTGNQALLLFGMKRAERPADDDHPFGHGKERFFWTFVVAGSLFTLGGGFSIYHGVTGLIHGHEVPDPLIALVVLCVAAVFEGAALRTAWKQFQAKRAGRSVRRALREAKDPEILTVLGEDTAALSGIAVAIAGIVLSDLTGIAAFDAAASICIGLILVGVAFFLAREMLGLLLGESATAPTRRRIADTVTGFASVERIIELRTMHIGPQELLIALEVLFEDGLDTDGIEQTIDEIEEAIRAAVPDARAIFIEPETSRVPARFGA